MDAATSIERTHGELIDWHEAQLSEHAELTEVLEREPNLTVAQAYAVQAALMQRRIRQGDGLIGYKAALTSKPMQAAVGIDEPVMGTLLGASMLPEGEPISVRNMIKATVEPEMAVVLSHDLTGPDVTLLQAQTAVAAWFPAVEVGDIRTGEKRRSLQMTICSNTFNGGQVVGGPPLAPGGFDPRVEGMVLRHNGEAVGSATGVEVLGHPLEAVVFIANKLAELGLGGLKAGQVIMTGSIVKSVAVAPGDEITAEFTRLGRLSLRFAQ